MEPAKSLLKSVADICEQLFRLFRDAGLGILFVLLVVFPHFLNSRLTDAGFVSGNVGGFVWQKRVEDANDTAKAAATTVASAVQDLNSATQTLDKIQKTTTDPTTKASISQLQLQLSSSLSQVKNTDASLKQTVLNQQDLLANSSTNSPATTSSSGWIYVGQISQDKQMWMKGQPEGIQTIPYPITSAAIVTLDDDLYLHADANGKNHTQGKILSVMRKGAQAKVIDSDLSHAASGGWFVWLKVESQ